MVKLRGLEGVDVDDCESFSQLEYSTFVLVLVSYFWGRKMQD